MDGKADIYAEPFAYRSAEIGPDGTINLYRIADLLQDTAGRHADALGFGMDDLGDTGTTWALTKLHILVQRPLVGGEAYTIQTWPAGTHRLWAIRRYRLLDTNGSEVGQAISHWMILDRVTHRPQRLPESLTGRNWPEPPAPEATWANFGEVSSLDVQSDTFNVRITEIDINNHVNNANYLAWALNESSSRLYPDRVAVEAEVLFEAEAKFGDTIQILSAYEELGNEVVSAHHLQRAGSDTRLAKVNIRWTKPAK